MVYRHRIQKRGHLTLGAPNALARQGVVTGLKPAACKALA